MEAEQQAAQHRHQTMLQMDAWARWMETQSHEWTWPSQREMDLPWQWARGAVAAWGQSANGPGWHDLTIEASHGRTVDPPM